ncbi:MAG: aminomethyl transferase family protein [Clostridia bacterium]|nr:aminomethyl transferase family protein [Clostridia bacterium]
MLVSTDSSVRQQHNSVRSNVGWYDFTHRLVEVKGPDALALLEKVCVAPIHKASVGGSKYTTMLNQEGLIIDDTIVTHMGENLYWVSGLYVRDQISWFAANKGNLNVEFRDITAEWKMYSVQGPNALSLVNLVVDVPVAGLRFFHMIDNAMDNVPVKVARAGYTGEKCGYEIYIAADKEELLVEKLKSAGEDMGACHVTELDVMVMTLAAEAGFVLMMDIYKASPYEVGFEKTIDWEKDFIGKEAVAKVREEGAKRKLLSFTVADDEALIYGGPLTKGNPLLKEGEVVGRATKYTYGFTCNKNIGYAMVDMDKAAVGDIVTINGYEAILTERGFI